MLFPCHGFQYGTELEVSRHIAVPEKWRDVGERENAYCTEHLGMSFCYLVARSEPGFLTSIWPGIRSQIIYTQRGLLREQGAIAGLSNIYKHLWTANSWIDVRRNWELKNWILKPTPTFQSCCRSTLLCRGVHCEYSFPGNVLNGMLSRYPWHLLLVGSTKISGHTLRFFFFFQPNVCCCFLNIY